MHLFITLSDVDKSGEADANENEDDLGGLFKVVSTKVKEKRSKSEGSDLNGRDCTRFVVEAVQQWDIEEVRD